MQDQGNGGCGWKMLASCILVASLGSIPVCSQSNAILYEGARLIIGDASAPIESGAFVVQNGHITAIGQKGSVKAPSGATRVDLTGKTVMPTMNTDRRPMRSPARAPRSIKPPKASAYAFCTQDKPVAENPSPVRMVGRPVMTIELSITIIE